MSLQVFNGGKPRKLYICLCIYRGKERGMETRKIMSTSSSDNSTKEDDEIILPGFRFHPTDEELVGFYLQRKVEKKSFSIELIKQVDIYKYDPWDLPRVSCAVGEKEWYFFCIRGRKYRNSIRPNRVTGSGFWKATGIDKPIYSSTHHCIGLKKSLVYYRGSAGKGTKTDWMMHEFRLPPPTWIDINTNNQPGSRDITAAAAQQAEVWTLCRILKRNSSYSKYSPTAAATKQKRSPTVTDASSKTCSSSLESDITDHYVNKLGDYSIVQQTDHDESKSIYPNVAEIRNEQLLPVGRHGCVDQLAPLTTTTAYSSFWTLSGDDEFFRDGNWDDLRSVVELAIDHYPSN